jgi:hypothetical protein
MQASYSEIVIEQIDCDMEIGGRPLQFFINPVAMEGISIKKGRSGIRDFSQYQREYFGVLFL